MNLAVIGTGYVGLVSGTCFAETGNKVICVDIDEEKVKRLQGGEVTIYEPGLANLFERNQEDNRLNFTTSLEEAVEKSDIIFLALPTPPGEDGSADLSYVLNVAEEIGKLITEYKIIVDKSTVPVGTAEKVREAISKHASCDFDVVANPEFLREGAAIEDFLKPDRVVIGTSSELARKNMEMLYEPFVRQGNPIHFMDERSAEMTKYAANSYLATRITFMNEVANLCEKVGADVDHVRKGMSSDKRIGNRFLFPGVGYGGSCFPKDVLALGKTAVDNNYDFKVLNSVIQVNNSQRLAVAEKIKKYYQGDLKDKVIAVWGLAFKPNTDDLREAPALYTIDSLLEMGAKVKAFDPEASENAKKIYGDKIEICDHRYDVLKEADALAIMTEWSIFRTPDFHYMEELMNEKVIFDGRNLYRLDIMENHGFYYESIGRRVVKPDFT